ncbi:MAG: ubiquinone biosynthesis regulatory protein kinase UbiB [Pseudomonadota bacterium]
MIQPVRQFLALLRISAILARYGLNDLLTATHLYRPMGWLTSLVPGARDAAKKPRGERLRLALQELGPVYVKFGQILSTRRDLIPRDIADELALLQDQVPPFPGEAAKAIVEKALRRPVDECFASFDIEPLASASIAQVHPATLPDGREVVVKVVRPDIEANLRRDVDLLKAVAGLAERYWEGGQRVHPLEIVKEFETYVFDELDMQREAANASSLRRNFEDSPYLYIPEVHWPLCKQRVLVMERVSGIPAGDLDALREAGVDLPKLAVRGVRVFYQQVFRDNLFHADMHPGNILVDASDPSDPTWIALDFGIVASLSPEDLYYISENFLALFRRDYRRVGQLHLDAGWVPPGTRIDELEAAVRTVGEPNFTRPLNEVSFGELLFKLFQVARRFNLNIQPQLIMLQKTLLNIEGLGRDLYPELDLWGVAKPELEAILREKYSVEHVAKDLREQLPIWLSQAPELPNLIRDYLTKATQGELQTYIASEDLAQLRAEHAVSHRRTLGVLAAGAIGISGALLTGLETGPWFLGGLSVLGLSLLGLSAVVFFRSARR